MTPGYGSHFTIIFFDFPLAPYRKTHAGHPDSRIVQPSTRPVKKSTKKGPVAIMFFTCRARIKYHLLKKLQARGIAAAMKRAGFSLVASQVIISRRVNHD